MTAVLQVLAVAAVIAGVIFGLPAAWTGGHEPLLEKWLAPSIPGAEHVKFAEPGHSTEYLFQGIGFGIAALGWLAALVLYKDARSTVPARLKATFPWAWAVVFNKYYVDELYQATIVRGALVLAAIQYWIDQNVIDRFVNFMGLLARAVAYLDNAFDELVVDGAINGLARLTWNSGSALRRLQTGHIQTYLYGALGGAIVFVIIQYVIR
jgi:NADH-quinone oxidoreductase subunit L